MNALGSFTTFYKRNPFDQDQGSRFRRQALEDLGAFTTFMKKDPKFSSANNKRSTRSISREDLAALGTFSSFMDPYQYYKRVSLEPVASSQAPMLSVETS